MLKNTNCITQLALNYCDILSTEIRESFCVVLCGCETRDQRPLLGGLKRLLLLLRCVTCVRKAASEISAELHLVQQAEGERKGERSPSQQLKETLKMHLPLQLEHAAIHTGCMTLHQQKWFLLSVAYSEDDLDLVNNPSLMFKHQVLQLN